MGTAAPELAQALAGRLQAIVALTGELVGIESPTTAVDGVRRVQESLAGALRADGVEVALAPLAGHGPVLDARVGGTRRPHVLVLGHADTVWPLGTLASWPFSAEGGLLRGPGAGDMKACLATAAAVLGVLAARPDLLPGSARLLVVPDEEAGSVASRPLIEEAARAADACLVLEAARPGGGVVVARGAVGAMRIAARGHAAHVTDDVPRRSAIAPLAGLVAAIEALGDPVAGVRATVNVFAGGTARQVAPEAAHLLVDLRAPRTADAEALAADVRRLAAAADRPDVRVEVAGGVTRPGYGAEGSAALLVRARAAAAELGVALEPVVERGGSDASFPGALGVPTLDGLGPVCHGSCSRDERVEEASIVPWGALLGALAVGAGRRA